MTSGFDIENSYHNFIKIKTAAEEILQEHKNSTEKFSGVNYGDFCYSMRNYRGCGMEGKYWEARK